MAEDSNITVNQLGPFLTKMDIPNIDLHAKTSIPTGELSHLRNGVIKSIQAKKFFLIAKASEITLKEMLQGVYPNLELITSSIEEKNKFDSIKEFFEHIDQDIITLIAKKTGMTTYRIKNIRNSKVNPLAHELYLIELASKTEPGTLFSILYNHLELNSPEEQERLRALERERSKVKK